ncbi:MAG: hypothetical protein ACFFAN_00970 [Promethearchaeota archaeon]
MNLWILDSHSGLKIFYTSYLKIAIDEDLVSGLLSAFNKFTMAEFQKPIESIEMGGFRWIYLEEPEYNLLFVAADTKAVRTEILRSKVRIIKDSFVKEYKEVYIRRGNSWVGNIGVFRPFLKIIDNYYYDWEDAEIVVKLADFFELLGIFQQLLNLIKIIVESRVLGAVKEIIYEQIEILFNNFQNQQEIKGDLELRKISFSRGSGFSIIEINPYNCDPLIVKKSLIKIIIDITNIIKEELGEDLSLKYFREGEIFNFIFNNIGLLKELNLDIFLLKLFLLI